MGFGDLAPMGKDYRKRTNESSIFEGLPDLKPVRKPQLDCYQEHHYTVAEIAEMWQLSVDAVRKIFCNEPGVLVLGDSNPRRRKRRYLTLRIPQSVVERVHKHYSLYG